MTNLGLPEQLGKELDDNGIWKYSIISKNDKKGRVCLKAFRAGSWEMIKYNAEEYEEAYKSLYKEVEIYNILRDKKITPKLISSYPLFVMEYIDSCTLRQYILISWDSKENISLAIKRVLEHYESMLASLEILKEKCEKNPFDRQLSIFLSKLMSSGPDGKHVFGIEKIHNRILGFYLRKCFIRKHFKNVAFKETVIHGDFHLNNEIIGAGDNIYIIDFENVVCGSATVELAYWYAQMWALLYENEEYENILNKEINKILVREYFEQNMFWRVVSLYKVGVSMNSRFHKFEKKIPLKKRIELWNNLRNATNV